MSGVNRIKKSDVTLKKLRGRELSDALAKELNSQDVPKYDENKKRR